MSVVLNYRNDGGSFHNILDANQTGETLFDILQQWCLCWNDLWYVKIAAWAHHNSKDKN